MQDALARLADDADDFARQGRRTLRISGAVTKISASHFSVEGLSPFLCLDDCVLIEAGDRSFRGQVIRIDKEAALVKSFESNAGIGLGARVALIGPVEIAPHASWKGRILNSLAEPIDNRGPLRHGANRPLEAPPPLPMSRARVSEAAPTGIRAIDAFTPLCRGQRIGVFAGSGVGKSTLLAMMTRSAAFDRVVICLVGERGREVRDFLEDALGESAAEAAIVVSTGDESPMMRRLAPLAATSVAEYFRDQGLSVLLIVDSVTRYAHALREIGLAAGEPPAANGFPPSVFAALPRLLERAGPGVDGAGSITAIYSVLVDGDDHNDPIADCVRGALDGHIVLEREIAEEGRYPAINVLKSLSRLADRAWSPEARDCVRRARSTLSRYEDTRDLRLLGGYQSGVDAELDYAMRVAPAIYESLKQSPQSSQTHDAIAVLSALLAE
jgi:flagellum-specific ATP synthase